LAEAQITRLPQLSQGGVLGYGGSEPFDKPPIPKSESRSSHNKTSISALAPVKLSEYNIRNIFVNLNGGHFNMVLFLIDSRQAKDLAR
jgi:hypothetical protein